MMDKRNIAANNKKIERELKEAGELYRALFQEAPLGVLLVDPETTAIVEFNDIAHSQLGYSREEFSKLTISQIEVEETGEENNSHFGRIMTDGIAEFETKMRTKNGEVRNVLITVKKIELLGREFVQCIIHDIPEIRKIQDALLKSEIKLSQLVDLSQEGFWVLDKEYNTTFVNPRLVQIFGYSESEMMGKSLFEFLKQIHIVRAKEFSTENAKGINGYFECKFSRKDGSIIYTIMTLSQIKDSRGRYSGTLALVSDITDRKLMEDQLEKYSKGLEDLVKQRTTQLAETQAQLVKSERLAAIGELGRNDRP